MFLARLHIHCSQSPPPNPDCVKNAEAQKSKETCSRSLSLLRRGAGWNLKPRPKSGSLSLSQLLPSVMQLAVGIHPSAT